MSWLKAATVSVNKPKTGIIARFVKALAGWEEARPIDVLHASDVTKPSFCARRWTLYDLTAGKPKGMYVSAALQATYDLGHATADVVVRRWARDFAYGNWQCAICKHTRTMCLQPEDGCNQMQHGGCDWRYREVQFVSKEFGISGSIDVLFDLGTPLLMLTELKIMAADEFDKMVAPLPEHRIRTQLYMKLVADSDSPYKSKINVHEARVFYVSRGFGRMNQDHGEILPFKEYVIERDDQGLDMQAALQAGKAVKEWREKKVVPLQVCGSPTDKMAKACDQCKLCFSGKYKPGFVLDV